jgi:hypothetical protein
MNGILLRGKQYLPGPTFFSVRLLASIALCVLRAATLTSTMRQGLTLIHFSIDVSALCVLVWRSQWPKRRRLV